MEKMNLDIIHKCELQMDHGSVQNNKLLQKM